MTIDPADIETQAQTPKQLRNDEGSVEERSIDELIKADVYARNAAATSVPWGMSIARTKPGGTV
jgi:hypothetical protein